MVELRGELRLGVVSGALLPATEVNVLFVGGGLDLMQQVVDRLVASRGHPNAPTLSNQMDDELRTGPRLTRPRRALNEQARTVQALGEALEIIDMGRSILQRHALRAS